MNIVCYSERILNPFRGVMNVIALDDAEAVTTDGVNWLLYVRDYFDTADDVPKNSPKSIIPTYALASGAKQAASYAHRFCPVTITGRSSTKVNAYSK